MLHRWGLLRPTAEDVTSSYAELGCMLATCGLQSLETAPGLGVGSHLL